MARIERPAPVLWTFRSRSILPAETASYTLLCPSRTRFVEFGIKLMFSSKCSLALLVSNLVLLLACGGGSMAPPPPTPVFSTLPPTTAAEATPYSYTPKAIDPAGGSVTFALTTAPAGAALSAGTLTWTPTPAQSRMANQFAVSATSSEGGRATQSWTLNPTGTVRGSWIDTYWTSSGPVESPINWSVFGTTPLAVIPQSDGSVVTLPASINTDGTFSISNVPGGYYWFQFLNNSYWTSSSAIDFGADVSGRRLVTMPLSQTTTFNFDVEGLSPVQSQDQFAFFTDLANPFNIGFTVPASSGSTSMNTFYSVKTNLDYAVAKVGFMLQYEAVSAGSISGIALGPEVTIADLSLVNGSVNPLIGTLVTSPQVSFDLSVKGSDWATAFQSVAPGPTVPLDAFINVFAQPYTDPSVLASTARFNLSLPLFLPNTVSTSGGFTLGWSGASSCVDNVQFSPLSVTSHPGIVTDEDFGTLQYGDPFPADWKRIFSLCQTASFDMPIPGSSATVPVLFGTGENTAVPSAPLSPLVYPVKDPTINGLSLFTASTVNASGVMLGWSLPSGSAPYGYKVSLFKLRTLGDGTSNYFPAATFTTGKTSIALPPLESGQTYVFALSARVDGKANVETSPNRSSLPTGYATVISAPITTN